MSTQQLIESVTQNQLREDGFFPNFTVGDTINVHYTIVEGNKERSNKSNKNLSRHLSSKDVPDYGDTDTECN